MHRQILGQLFSSKSLKNAAAWRQNGLSRDDAGATIAFYSSFP